MAARQADECGAHKDEATPLDAGTEFTVDQRLLIRQWLRAIGGACVIVGGICAENVGTSLPRAPLLFAIFIASGLCRLI